MASMRAFMGLRNSVTTKLLQYSSITIKRTATSYCIDPSIGLSDEQKRLQILARDFAKTELFPQMKEWNKLEQLPPQSTLKKAGSMGLGAIYCKPEYGGFGMSRLDASIIYEQLAAGCASTAAYMSIHNMCAWIIDFYGSDELRQRYVKKLAAFDNVASFFLAEPMIGDDPTAVQLTAKRDGDHFVMNGSKLVVLGYDESQLYVVVARHEKHTADKGIFLIAVDSDTKGIAISERTRSKYAWKDEMLPRTITFRNCRVPVTQQIGGDVDGLNISILALNGSRVNVASCWLGSAQMCMDMAIAHFRKKRGQTTMDVLSDEWELATMAAKLVSARLLVREAARHIQEKSSYATSFSAMAKLQAAVAGTQIMHDLLSIYQRFGVIKASPMTEYLHDCASHNFVVGSDAEMRVTIAGDLLNEPTFV